MMLLTKANRRELPPLYSSDEKFCADNFEELAALPDEEILRQLTMRTKAVVKFFDPGGAWTWYAAEFDGDDLFWGFVDGHEAEFGYFSLRDLTAYRNRFGLGVERDRHFRPESLAALKDAANERHQAHARSLRPW